MNIISLGWGVQSFTLAAMAALGELEADTAIHADTTHESSLTYAFAARWTVWLEERGVNVHTVKPNDGVRGKPIYRLSPSANCIMIPASGERGMLMRQCTNEWKIAPLRRWLQANRNGERIRQYIGISLDEFQRMRQSDVKYIDNVYPLVEKRMTRGDCMNWLDKHGLEIPPKSACVFCPFHSDAEWRKTKAIPADWQKAVEVDELIRDARLPGRLYLHRSCKPLAEIDLRTAEERGQMNLWENECTGICGV